MTRKALITGAFRFPDGDAAAFRVQGLARLLTGLGWTVEFAGWESNWQGQAHYVYKDWDCHAMAEFRETDLPPLQRLLGFMSRGRRTLAWMDSRPRYDAVIAYNPPAWFARQLLKRAEAQHFLAVLDTTEWYESEHLPGGRFGLAAMENWWRMNVVYPQFERVICISNFLLRHFGSQISIRVPPLIEPYRFTKALPPKPTGAINFVYAGQAGRKDRLAAFIEALPETSQALGIPVKLTVAGMTKNELRANLSVPESALDFVDARGRLSPEDVQEIYAHSHFSVFFRQNLRYAWAGFPTKAMESWLHGCPIITNRVGDIGELIQDGLDGLLLDEDNLRFDLPRKLIGALQTIGFDAMSQSARNKAECCFSDTLFFQPLEALLSLDQRPRKLNQ